MIPSNCAVAIVGGGPVGLVCSILLSLNHIDHVLFERQPDTSIHPKAVGLNQRTIEIFRKIGVEEEILRAAAPPSVSGRTAWYTSFGTTGREICTRDAWGGGQYEEAYELASPCRYALLPQIRLEPILKRRALEFNPNGIFYGHEVDRVEEYHGNVVVRFHDREKGEVPSAQSVNARYVLGADGGRMLTEQLGISMNGESNLVDMVTAHIRSPISQYRPDPSIFLHWFIRPELGGSLKTGYLYHVGPYPFDPETEEWVFACARLPHEQVQPFGETDMLRRLHQTLQIPDLKVELLSMSHWHVNAKVAERFRSKGGHIFLVGDAAHRVPPWGALGLNSGIQDADNLVWKLALALKRPNESYEGLLNSYDTERRPIGERVAKTSLYNMQAHALVLDQRSACLQRTAKGTMQSPWTRKRHEVTRALETLDVEFYAHGAEVGWFYEFDYETDYGRSGMTFHHPQLKENGEMELCTYRQSTKPGSQLPHAWLGRFGVKRSTRELAEMERLVLLGMSPSWRSIRHPLIQVMIIDGDEEDHGGADGFWNEICGRLAERGALLVRPDNIIAYRFADDKILSQPEPLSEIADIVKRVLRLEA
ncbi:hypothetical protein LTR37_006656 [Vermiconidia calcicola]|uniref:Uncharacterized protein n=1 Tax=Vermiconidia calcicola TaxID=1690605 RepID=A0ACC3NFS4_9PEZI|nr:hypothetical protein LTR37_006656 [Vermiconidia calcicola]